MEEKLIDTDIDKAKRFRLTADGELEADFDEPTDGDEGDAQQDALTDVIVELAQNEPNELENAVEEVDYDAAQKEKEARDERKRLAASRMCEEAQALYERGLYDDAGEKFSDSLSLWSKQYQAYFGIAKIVTKDFTDFDEYNDTRELFVKLAENMDREVKDAFLAERGDELKQLSATNAATAAEKREKENLFREKKGEFLTEQKSKAKKRLLLFLSVGLLLLAFTCVSAGLIFSTYGDFFFIATFVGGAAFLVAAVPTLISINKFVSVRYAVKKNNDYSTSPEGREILRLEGFVKSVNDFVKLMEYNN